MEAVTWRRRIVQDMLFGIEGSGWHPPDLRDAVGFRWSGPGHFSVLRVHLPAGAGRGEAHLALKHRAEAYARAYNAALSDWLRTHPHAAAD